MNALAEQQIPIECRPFDQARQNFENIASFLETREALQMTHSELERELEKKSRELMCIMLQEHLDTLSPADCLTPVTDSDGVACPRVRLQKRNLETIFGTVSAERMGYGREGAESLHPMDAELNLPNELYSLEIRRRVAMEVAKSSFNDVVTHVGDTTGAQVHKRQTEELAIRAAQDFDDFYSLRQGFADPNHTSGSIQVISVDGKGVVMRTQDLREQTRKAAEARKQKMGKRLSKGEKRNAKRMATVATVYTIAPFERTPEELVAENQCALAHQPKRPRPEQKRVWASIEKEPVQVIEDALQEAGSRDPTNQKTWVALVDGNKAQIRILNNQNKKQSLGLTIIVDIIHVIEYLWAAGRVFHNESGPELESWVRKHLLEILRGKAGYVAGGIHRSATLRKLSAKEREPADTCARYLLNNKPYLRYDLYLEKGLPIATGVIEGACRHLVKDRMDVTGARWSLAGAEAVLQLRALRSSQDFDEYWKHHEQCEYERNHKALYENGIVPPIKGALASKRTPLKLVK